ncbi:MAG: hypothetical protein LBJ48_04375 [Coriobacteriales bacterium]|jgi:hypothetical protein|nr:hypothetical protein [Coriobacteriales bacterium]
MHEEEKTGIKSQTQDKASRQAEEQVGKSAVGQSSPEIAAALQRTALRGSQASQLKPLHAWIVIVLLTLLLIVNSIGLVLQVLPTSMPGGSINFVPNENFQGGLSQDFERPDSGSTA